MFFQYLKDLQKNNMRLFFFHILFYFLLQSAYAQNYSVQILHDSVNTSLRGLSVVNDSVIWVSGSNGYIGKSTNAGISWNFRQIHPYDSAEFRDIEAFDENIAIVMSSVQPACILKTIDGGITWNEVFRDDRPEVFLDAIDFYEEKGVCLGDPMNGWFFLLSTSDSGDTWSEIKTPGKISLNQKLAAFAASGSVIKLVNTNSIYFATGGEGAYIFYSEDDGLNWEMMPVDIAHGNESSGIFSFDINTDKNVIAGGGDYLQPKEILNSISYLKNFKNIGKPVNNPIGYISCVKFWNKSKIISCGTNGIAITELSDDISVLVSRESFNVIGISATGSAVYLAGGNGRVVKLIGDQ